MKRFVLGALLSVAIPGWADTLKLAVGQRGNRDTAVAELGQRAGIFRRMLSWPTTTPRMAMTIATARGGRG